MAQGPGRGVGRHKTGGAVAEQCRKKSGCRATNSPGLGWGEGPPGGEQRLSHSCCSKEGHLALLPPPREVPVKGAWLHSLWGKV